MERLTHIDNSGWYVDDQSVAYDEKRRGKEIDRLAAYEDIDMMPKEITDFVNRWKDVAELAGMCKQHGEHLKELIQAESNGRLVMLPPNDPLTLDELREMDGEPVWIERRDGGTSGWAIVGDADSLYGVYFVTVRGGMRLPYRACGDMWRAFRRKPEEV